MGHKFAMDKATVVRRGTRLVAKHRGRVIATGDAKKGILVYNPRTKGFERHFPDGEIKRESNGD